MSDSSTTPPIVVNASPVPDQTTTAVRQAILVASGAATVFGATKIGTELGALTVIAAPLAGLITIIAGQFHTRHSAERQAVMAEALPDHIASTKPRKKGLFNMDDYKTFLTKSAAAARAVVTKFEAIVGVAPPEVKDAAETLAKSLETDGVTVVENEVAKAAPQLLPLANQYLPEFADYLEAKAKAMLETASAVRSQAVAS